MRTFGASRPSERWIALACASVLVVLLAAPLLPSGVDRSVSTPSANLSPARLHASSTGCTGSQVATSYPGVLVDRGGPTPHPSVSGVPVDVSYHYTQVFYPASILLPSYSCPGASVTAQTGASGAFTLSPVIPTAGCVRSVGCWAYVGPYGPLAFGIPGNVSVPSTDFVGWSIGNGSVTIARTAALDHAALTPSGFATVSVLAPVDLIVVGVAGDGSASPATLAVNWTVSGSGWTALSPTVGTTFRLEAAAGASIATIRAWVNGSFHGAPVTAAPVSVLLTAVATTLTQGGIVPTSLDAGVPAMITLDGSGSTGYTYNGSFNSGTGATPLPLNCGQRTQSLGVDTVHCTASLAYRAPGIYQPSANLTNGYSQASWTFAPVTVSAVLGVLVTPDPIVAYPHQLIGLTVSVAAGTGTAPYGPACLATGIGSVLCDTAPGSPWAFQVAYPAAGSYDASVSVADSGGTNWTHTVPVVVVDRPGLSSLDLASSEVPSGGSVSVGAAIAGGALPLSYWWNYSAPGAPSSTEAFGTLATDAVLHTAFPVNRTGTSALTLTVVDALGTRVSASAAFVVIPVIATSIHALGPSSASTMAGVPVLLSFVAEDALSERVAGFIGPAEVTIAGAGSGPIWVNATSSGPAARTALGLFSLGPAAWRAGYANFTVTAALAGTLTVGVSAAVGIGGPTLTTVTVGADRANERLSGPSTALAGARANSTLYAIADRFGNPIPSGFVVVRTVFGPSVSDVPSPILARAGSSVVWVNYSAPGNAEAIVYVLSESGALLLPAIRVPSIPTSALPIWAVPAAALGLTAGLIAGVLVLRHRRRATLHAEPESERTEAALKRLAVGRAHVLARVPSEEPVDLATIALGWTEGPAPDPSELAEWVSSLVSEGVFVATVAPDGRPVFARTSSPKPVPRVDLDPDALNAALARQAREADDDGSDPPAPGARAP
ncbi:MAG: hypothetical protein L3J93_01675 [Thermoplasmata archaeon]|nr:hypothetical protein [Thermoplasmata archaeon]